MAVAELWGKRFLSLTLDGSDWVCSRDIRPKSVHLHGSATGDILVLREGSSAGPIMTKLQVAADLTQGTYFNGDLPIKPSITHAQCTFGTVGNVTVCFEFD